MEYWIAPLLNWGLLLLFSAVCAFLLTLLWRVTTSLLRQRERKLSLQEASLTAQSQLMIEQTRLLDKAMALLSTTDPLAFQQVQVMSTPSGYDDDQYDPSDEAEIRRIRERDGSLDLTEDLDAEERSFLAAELGVDPYFLRAD